MLKTIVVWAAGLVMLAFVVNSAMPISTAQNLKNASSRVNEMEQNIESNVENNQALANGITESRMTDSEAAADSDPTKQVEAFTRNTGSLKAMKEKFQDDIASFQAACNAERTDFAKHFNSIVDDEAKRDIAPLSSRIARNCTQKLAVAQLVLGQIDSILAQADDLANVIACVHDAKATDAAAHELTTNTERVKSSATEYSHRAGELLGMLSREVQS